MKSAKENGGTLRCVLEREDLTTYLLEDGCALMKIELLQKGKQSTEERGEMTRKGRLNKKKGWKFHQKLNYFTC